jgi:hypothetical protein
MKIKITQSILDAGCKGSIYDCPVALALQIEYPEATVGRSFAYFNRFKYALSNKLVTLIRQFDRGQPIEPCTLVIKHEQRILATS